jgi:glutathione synthase/RimK-type ligase-like ATP-grasp enzyme
MTRSLAVLMDPIGTINPKKDTTLALLLEAQRRGYSLHYMTQGDLGGRLPASTTRSRARTRPSTPSSSTTRWCSNSPSKPASRS